MGAWGNGVFDDDLAQDVRAGFEDLTEGGAGPEQAVSKLLRAHADLLEDPAEGPTVYLAPASLLLDHGIHAHAVLDPALRIVEQGEGLERWREAGGQKLQGR